MCKLSSATVALGYSNYENALAKGESQETIWWYLSTFRVATLRSVVHRPSPLQSALAATARRSLTIGARLADVRSVLRSAANLSLNDLTISLSLSV